MRRLIPGLVAVAAAAGFSMWAYPHLPAQVATHFNFHGDPDGWSSRFVAAVVGPALGLALAGLFVALPRIDPKRANYALFGSTYWTVVNAVLIFVLGVDVLSLGKALGWPVDMNRVAALGTGGLFVLLGNLMTRMRPNWFMGIRTPWTLSSDTVWRKTHRLGGVAFIIAGLLVATTAVVASTLAFYCAIGAAAAATLGPVVYSYVLWKREQHAVQASGTQTRV